jgi:hypothetical protein
MESMKRKKTDRSATGFSYFAPFVPAGDSAGRAGSL